MNILLIRPKPDKETIGLQSVMICEPLELMTLKAVLKHNGHNVTILDMILEKKPLEYYINLYHPDIVGITGYISHVNVMKEYARVIKLANCDIKVFCGGVHAEVCPEDFVCDNIDKICKSTDDFYNAVGCNDTKDILPDRNLPEKYRKKYYYLFHNNCALIKTSYGCPYNCNFCFCKEISPYIVRDMDCVMRELQQIKQDEVYIVDDDFLFDRNKLELFCDRVEQLGIRKKYLVYGRADFVAQNEDIIERLKHNGLRAVIVGIEAATQEELDAYNKKTTRSDNINAVRILKKHDIEVYATVILGDKWDKSDFKRLYHFLKELGIVFVNLQPFTPMPGTGYFDEYKDRLIVPRSEYEKWDMAHLVIRPSNISVRAYYMQIVKLYCLLSLSPKSSIYMIKKYGLKDCLKLSLGAMKIACQYLAKIIKG